MIKKSYSLKLKDNAGITLLTLVITVIVLLIIAGISVTSGVDTINKTRLKTFYTSLEIIQKRVDEINSTDERYTTTIDGVETEIILKEAGEDLTQDQITFINNILTDNSVTDITAEDFRYFSKENLYEQLDIHDIDYNVFINFETRTIISEEGIKIGNTTYYMLQDSSYHVESNSSKNEGNIKELEYSTPIQYGENKYKVTVTPSNTVGDLGEGGKIKYKKSSSKYWITTTNFEIILEKDVNYDIMYEDLNKNTLETKIIVQLENNNMIVNTIS